MSHQELVSEALNLPLTERLMMVNTLVESFNPMQEEVASQWKEELGNRGKSLNAGTSKTISYDEFFGEH